MARKRSRDDRSGSDAPLTSNPFAQLGALGSPSNSEKNKTSVSKPAGRAPSSPAAASASAASSKPAFRIGRTKKGGYPLSYEKRAKGKAVTVLRKVSGDAEALLSLLKKTCGVGGRLCEEGIELQGDQRERVEALLRKM